MNTNIYTYGNDARVNVCREYLEKHLAEGLNNVFILPIPSTRDGEHLTGTQKKLCELASDASQGDLIIGYGLPKFFADAVLERGAVCIDAAEDEEYLMQGALQTATGAMAKILCCTGIAPEDIRIGIIGFGRIGKRLAEIFTFLGSEVTVFTSRARLRIELGRLGIRAVTDAELSLARQGLIPNPFESLDILVNTAPAAKLNSSDAEALSRVSVIELASGGNIPDGIPYVRYASVPAELFPRSAGIAYGEFAVRKIKEKAL